MADGSINLITSGGVSPYTYTWSNGDTTENIVNIDAGYYAVTLTDKNGCMSIDSAEVIAPPAYNTMIDIISETCPDDNNGMVDLTVGGGTAPYTYLWNNGAQSEDMNGLGAGNYIVTITDSSGCIAIDSATVGLSSPGPQTGSIIGQGTVEEFETANYSVGFNTGYTYLWIISGGNQISGGQTNSISIQWGVQGTGQITLVESDSFGCTGDTTVLMVNIVEPVGIWAPEVKGQRILVIPNPSKGLLTIKTDMPDKAVNTGLTIYNLIGQLIFEAGLEDLILGGMQIDISDQPAGMYYLRLETPDGRYVSKLLLH